MRFAISQLTSNQSNPPTISFQCDLDVSLIAIAYYGFGYYARKLIRNRFVTRLCALAFVLFIAADQMNLIHYSLDMKNLGYTHRLLDLLIPITGTLAICEVSHLLVKVSFLRTSLSQLGIASLSIMYMHLPLNMFLIQHFNYGFIVFVLVGVGVSFTIHTMLLNRFTSDQSLVLRSVKDQSRCDKFVSHQYPWLVSGCAPHDSLNCLHCCCLLNLSDKRQHLLMLCR